MLYQFIVGYSASKDELMAGRVTSGRYGVSVEANNSVEARLLAESMVGALGVEPTSVEEVWE